MFKAAVTLALALSAVAYQITTPGQDGGWTANGTNTLTWTSVSTDVSPVSIVLVNGDQTLLSGGSLTLAKSVNATSETSIAFGPPAGGFPTGDGFQINFLNGSTSGILAQSTQFSIAAGSNSSTTSAAETIALSTSSGSSSTSSTGTSSTSGSNPSQTGSSSGALANQVSAGLLGAVALAGALLA